MVVERSSPVPSMLARRAAVSAEAASAAETAALAAESSRQRAVSLLRWLSSASVTEASLSEEKSLAAAARCLSESERISSAAPGERVAGSDEAAEKADAEPGHETD